jgi:hypothetical protein
VQLQNPEKLLEPIPMRSTLAPVFCDPTREIPSFYQSAALFEKEIDARTL